MGSGFTSSEHFYIALCACVASKRSIFYKLNENVWDVLQAGGEVFLSNAVIRGMYCLRACIVNFRTSRKDIEEILEIVVREGKQLHRSRNEAARDTS